MGCRVSKEDDVVHEIGKRQRELHESRLDQAQLKVLVGEREGSCIEAVSPGNGGSLPPGTHGETALITGSGKALAAAVGAALGSRARLADDEDESRGRENSFGGEEKAGTATTPWYMLETNSNLEGGGKPWSEQAEDDTVVMDSESDSEIEGSIDSELAKIILSCCQDFDSLEL